MKKDINIKKRILIFVGLKVTEIVGFLALIFVPYRIGYAINPNSRFMCNFHQMASWNWECVPTIWDKIGQWFMGAFWVIVVIIGLNLIRLWTINNWKWAGRMVK